MNKNVPVYHIAGIVITPQAAKVAKLMTRDGHVTRLSAMHHGVANITARIAELRNAGMRVDCIERHDLEGRRYGKWSISPTNGDTYTIREVTRGAAI